MTELNDEHFLQNIRQHPEDKLAVGIYGDWLEEQGDPKATQVRAFLNNDFTALRQSLGTFDLIIDELTEQQNRNLAIDCAWRVFSEISNQQDYSYLLNILKTYAHDPTESTRHSLVSQMGIQYGSHREDQWSPPQRAVYRVIYYSNAKEAAEYASFRALEYHSNRSFERDIQFLMAVSYLLFGFNLQPDSFERTGLLA